MIRRALPTVAVVLLLAVTAALYLLMISSLDRLLDECSSAVREDPAACIPRQPQEEGNRP